MQGSGEVTVYGTGQNMRVRAESNQPLTLTVSRLRPGHKLRARAHFRLPASGASTEWDVIADAKGTALCKSPEGADTLELAAAKSQP